MPIEEVMNFLNADLSLNTSSFEFITTKNSLYIGPSGP